VAVHALGLQATHPVEQTTIGVRNLLDGDGLRWIYANVTHNFVRTSRRWATCWRS
jgi:p-aminobenzoyl-glutamate transporter AbgT